MDEAGPPPPSAGKSLMSRLASDPVGTDPGAILCGLARKGVGKRAWSARPDDINRKIVVCDKTKGTAASRNGQRRRSDLVPCVGDRPTPAAPNGKEVWPGRPKDGERGLFMEGADGWR